MLRNFSDGIADFLYFSNERPKFKRPFKIKLRYAQVAFVSFSLLRHFRHTAELHGVRRSWRLRVGITSTYTRWAVDSVSSFTFILQ
jgi:hypothetical protein